MVDKEKRELEMEREELLKIMESCISNEVKESIKAISAQAETAPLHVKISYKGAFDAE